LPGMESGRHDTDALLTKLLYDRSPGPLDLCVSLVDRLHEFQPSHDLLNTAISALNQIGLSVSGELYLHPSSATPWTTIEVYPHDASLLLILRFRALWKSFRK
jgi:hypothetical protein